MELLELVMITVIISIGSYLIFIFGLWAYASFNQNILHFTTTGTSMGDLIPEGSNVECIPKEDYAVGDIVIYNNTWWGGALRAHRIIYKDGNMFLMQGDNETEMDAGVQLKEHIICKITDIFN